MLARGYRRGDTIAVLSETRPEYIECDAALAALGITVAALNIRLHSQELAACLRKCRPTALLVSDTLADVAAGLGAGQPASRHWIAFGRVSGFEEYELLVRQSVSEAPPQVAHGSDIHNRSLHQRHHRPTQGRPDQPASRSDAGPAARAMVRLSGSMTALSAGRRVPLRRRRIALCDLLTGGTYATLRRADVQAMFRRIERERLSWTLLLPGVITDFLNHPERAAHDLSSLRFAIGYANMMPQVIAQLTQACNIDFYDAFGQSESSYLLAHRRSGPGELPSLRKLPSPLMEVRIVDDDMNEMPVGQAGECVVRGPSVMSGYLDDDAANSEVFRWRLAAHRRPAAARGRRHAGVC